MYNQINYEESGNVATIVLNSDSPDNKLNTSNIIELIDCLKRAVTNGNKVVVIQGQSHIFCGGGTIGDFSVMTGPEINEFGELLQEMVFTIKALPIPVVAAISGNAFGGGLSLVEACDLAIAIHSAEFAIPEIQGGFCPAVALVSVAHAFGESMAKKMALTGEPLSATKACELGLLTKVVEKEDLYIEINELTATIIAGNPTAYRITKEIAFKLSEPQLRNMFTVAIGKLVEFLGSADAKEVVLATLEHREKVYKSK